MSGVHQPSMFGGGEFAEASDPKVLARRDDPQTSKDAAAQAGSLVMRHHALILDALRRHVDGVRTLGLSVYDIAGYTKLDAHAIGKRCGELEKRELAYVPQINGRDMTKPSPSGRECRLWAPVRSAS